MSDIIESKLEVKINIGDTILDHYKILKQIGKGGMDSTIFLVEDINLSADLWLLSVAILCWICTVWVVTISSFLLYISSKTLFLDI